MTPSDWRYDLQRAEEEAVRAISTLSAAAAGIHAELSRRYSLRALRSLTGRRFQLA